MNTNESETTMTEHNTTVTGNGNFATCTCGWYSRWAAADEDAAAHKRHHAKEEA